MHGIQGAKIALLIDFDNVILGVEDPGFDVELVVNALRARGIVVMGRAYGDWYRHHRHRRKLMEQGIELVETPVFGPVIKNSADIRIVLDGIDVALAHSHIDTFCLVSGDSDFLPLIKRLQLLGKNVIVIAGLKFTSELVRRNCNEYIAYENLFAESIGATEDVSTLDGACQLLQRAINTLLERGMDARSSTVKQMMLQMNPAFSERTFGCSQFKQFLDKATRTGVVKLGDRDSHTGEYAVLLMENGSVVEAPEKSAPRDDASSRRRGRERAPREPRTETASTRSEAPRDNAERNNAERDGAEAAAPLAIEDELLAESGAAFSTGEKAQTRGTLRRGRLKFSAKSGVSAAAPVATESAPEKVEEKSEHAAPDAAEAPREYSQTAENESVSEAATPANETSDATASDADAESAAPKKRATRGGRRRKPKSETAESPATTESASSESATELDGAATSLQDLKAATTAEVGAPVETASKKSGATATEPNGEAAAEAGEKPAPKKRATRGGRRKKPAAEKAGDDQSTDEKAE